jgi:hypothetical protein
MLKRLSVDSRVHGSLLDSRWVRYPEARFGWLGCTSGFTPRCRRDDEESRSKPAPTVSGKCPRAVCFPLRPLRGRPKSVRSCRFGGRCAVSAALDNPAATARRPPGAGLFRRPLRAKRRHWYARPSSPGQTERDSFVRALASLPESPPLKIRLTIKLYSWSINESLFY